MGLEALDGLTLVLLIPAAFAIVLALVPGYALSSRLNVIASLLTFLAAISLVWMRPAAGLLVHVDDLNIVFVLLNTLIGFTTSIYSAGYFAREIDSGNLSPSFLRFYHALYQSLIFVLNLAVLANNLGLMWVGVEFATLSTVLMVGLYRTSEAVEAAWKYFILGSVGIALALFGTILLYMAARPVAGHEVEAMAWTAMMQSAASFDPGLLNLGFVFLLLGYGTKVGLAPMHGWLPDAHAEGPSPTSALLSGLLLNVALHALLRFKMLLNANGKAIDPGPLLVAIGLVSMLFGAFMLYRRGDMKRLFAYSSIEHMGIAAFAFGIGGAFANFAGLLHLTMHSLTKSALFFSAGQIAQVKGTRKMSEIGGLTATHPVLGWSLVAGVLALAGLPPFGIFMSEFLIVSSALARQPGLAILLVIGIVLALGALLRALNGLAFGDAKGSHDGISCSSWPMLVHIVLVLIGGIFLPAVLVVWFQNVAKLLG